MSTDIGFLIDFLDEEIYFLSKEETEHDTTQAQVYIISNEVSPANPSTDLAVLLSKILAAVKLDFSKVVMKEQYEDTMRGKVVYFGDLSLNEKYKVEQGDGVSILRADFLRSIAVSSDLKKLLWGALKELF